MTTSATSRDTSERKRLSIPRADRSVLEWWDLQHDVGLSVRMLIRAEIERSGYVDTAYQPVSQQPRRGRPPVAVDEAAIVRDTAEAEPVTHPVAATPAAAARSNATPVEAAPAPALVSTPAPSGFSLDDLMNG